MDTKLKNNKYIASFILIISILVGAIGICMVYPRIEKESEKFSLNVFESKGYFLDDINKSNYALYYKTSKNISEGIEFPSDLSLDFKNVENYEGAIENYKERFNQNVYNWYDNLNIYLKNLDYYALNKSNDMVIKRDDSKIEELLDNNSKNIVDKLKNYKFYMVIDYDENGNMNISNIYNADKKTLLNKLEETQTNEYSFDLYELQGANIKSIKNMTYIYAVPEELIYSDHISYAIDSSENYSYSQASILYINIAMVFIVIVSLLIPYKDIKDTNVFKIIKKLPIEIWIIIIATAIALIYNSGEIIIGSSIRGELIKIYQIEFSSKMVNILTYLLNIIYFVVCFSLISFGIILLKHIHKCKIKLYFKENSLIVKLISYMVKFIKKIFKDITSFDLKDKNNFKVIKLLIINLIIMSVLCSFWFFGIIGAIIYSVIILMFIRKKYNKINYDYNKLITITNEIASGNLEVNTQDDLGIFNSLKEEISCIQKGFKNAVKEEVKSQKMKTELISNVSHDLKTPLTSIITYVDLLKDENISENKRETYLEVLDRKSQRLKELIEDLFEVSKATSGDINLNLMKVDVVSLMKQILLELDDKIIESELIIKKNLPNEKVVLTLDSQRMFRVFENLIINITKYSMRGSRVYIDILENEEDVVISLRNITAEEICYDVNEITDRFVRGDKSRNTEGSGLGLAIAKSFVELHGGTFVVSTDGDLFKVIIRFRK